MIAEPARATHRSSIAPSIKRITAPAHVAAEAAVARLAPMTSRAAYASYLARLHPFYAALEPALFERLDGLVPDAKARRKLPLLDADLALLGAAPARVEPALPRIDSDAAAMGVAYVLEGKTLGSRFLLADARAQLGLDADTGAAFFAGYGANTGAMWRGYQSALAAFVDAHGRRACIVAAARATFTAFTQTLAR